MQRLILIDSWGKKVTILKHFVESNINIFNYCETIFEDRMFSISLRDVSPQPWLGMNEIGSGMKTTRMNGTRRPKAFSRRCARYVWWLDVNHWKSALCSRAQTAAGPPPRIGFIDNGDPPPERVTSRRIA